jgi:hypothetical protein
VSFLCPSQVRVEAMSRGAAQACELRKRRAGELSGRNSAGNWRISRDYRM